ncbi:DUF6221 family protein [Streptomyces filamentosus]|uniref:Uncharacterized protein n=1 Tax=Streptomyces filamentosus TaxID=67294 RepID=A0A919EH00_STRFL|nr:DUF6221 family protein [Streptomyces filamentosus]GHF77203.1 hypothetical protein GCM10017667_00610 [Streptomyces filamentosus]
MQDLVAFLRARLDEDERIARSTVPGPWSWTPKEDVWGQCGPTLVHNPGDDETEVLAGIGHDAWGLCVADGAAGHIARHDPERVLAEVEAKRKIVALHEPVILHAGGGAAHFDTTRVCRSCEPPKQFPETAYPCATLRLLASIYDGHLDYREEWRPL